ncbi:MAG: branched-chain amino acid ABC transporter permease [Rhodospirillales bacterium]|nr:branched-chain amino acid ABC transporter permease [Rhodospirillales bacterium]
MSEAVVHSTPKPNRRAVGWILAAIGLAILLVAPFLGIYPIFLMKLMCFALFAAAFNLMLGYVGLLSFGHAAFFGMSAYVAGHAVKVWGVGTILGIAGGTLAAAIMGVVFGAIAIRQRGIYFAMITLALAQMVYFFCLQAPFTHGEDGIQGIPRGSVFGLVNLHDPLAMYYFVAAIFLAGYLIIYRTVNSPFGEALKGIRENEPRMISLGYPVARIKVAAFTISAALTGLAGATKAIVFQTATLTDVHWHMSGEVVLMTLIGGMGTVFGPVVGAGVIIALQNYLATIGSWVTVVMGTIFVVCVLTFRRGIVGELQSRLKLFG